MTGISLRVGGERKAYIFFRPAREPPLLLDHGCRVRSKKSQRIKNTVSKKIIHIPRSSLTEDLARFVKVLQGDQVLGKVRVSLCRFVQFSSDAGIVVAGYEKPFPLASMFA